MTRGDDMGAPVRVLHVITRLVHGGAQENTLLTVQRLDTSRYAATLASGPTFGSEGSLESSIPASLPFVRIPELVRDPHPAKDALALGRLYLLMRRHRFHIVHTHTTKAGLLGRLAARLAGVPIVIHTPHGHAFHGYIGEAGSGALKRVERWLARHTDRIVCLTEAERQDHIRLGIGPPEQFEVIHSGVDIERFKRTPGDGARKRHELGLPEHGPLVGCVARLVPVKGVDHLLEAVPGIRAAIPQAVVVFIGDGPLRPIMEARAAALGLNGAVVFLGLRKDVPDILPLFDVVVLPSLNEGMGRAAVEAMASGKPVVGSRVGGIQDLVADGQNGLLVPPGDPPALAGAVIRCLKDPASAAVMGSMGKAAADGYSIETMIAKIEQLYVRCLAAEGY
jgi:glycosyltransferase involved in cell wall biosynthesis